MGHAIKKIIFPLLISVILISLWRYFSQSPKNIDNKNQKLKALNLNKREGQNQITKSSNKKTRRIKEKIIAKKTKSFQEIKNRTTLDEGIYLVNKPKFKLGKKVYDTSNASDYRILEINNRERLVTNKVFLTKKDLNILKRIFPNNKIKVKRNHVVMEIKFKELKKNYNTLKKEKLKFNHEFLRPSPSPL